MSCFASRGSPVRSRPRPPGFLIAKDLRGSSLICSFCCARTVQNRAVHGHCAQSLEIQIAENTEPSHIDGRNFLEKSSALMAAESRSRAGCNASVVCDIFGVVVMLHLHSECFSTTVARNVATARRPLNFRHTSPVVRPSFELKTAARPSPIPTGGNAGRPLSTA